MVKILLMADQERLERLFDFVGESPMIAFRVSRSLREGSQDIVNDPPDFLFVQNHLSGLSAEIIARHLTSQLEDKNPTVVIFTDGRRENTDRDLPYHLLETGRTDEELAASIIGLISESMTSPAPEEPAPLSVDGSLDLQSTSTLPPPTEGDGAEEPMNLHTPPPFSPPETPFDMKLKAALEESPEPVPLAEVEDSVSLSPSAGVSTPTTNRIRRNIQKSAKVLSPSLLWGISAVSIVVIIALVLIFSRSPSPTSPSVSSESAPLQEKGSPESKTPSPATVSTPSPPLPRPESSPPPPPAVVGLETLPSFIPRDRLDPTYGKSHPGWELYRGNRTEFKVYREGGRIRAVQAIDRSGVGIPEDFFHGALKQMTGTREFMPRERETKGNFKIEKGTVEGNIRIILYRTEPRGAIRAFVVHFN